MPAGRCGGRTIATLILLGSYSGAHEQAVAMLRALHQKNGAEARVDFTDGDGMPLPVEGGGL